MSRIKKNIISIDREELNKLYKLNDSNEKSEDIINQQLQEKKFSKLTKRIFKMKNPIDKKLKAPSSHSQKSLMLNNDNNNNLNNKAALNYEMLKNSFSGSLTPQILKKREPFNEFKALFSNQMNNQTGVQDNDPLNNSDLEIGEDLFINNSCTNSKFNKLTNAKNEGQIALQNNQFDNLNILQSNKQQIYQNSLEQNKNFLNINSTINQQLLTNPTANCINTNIHLNNTPISYTHNSIHHNFFTKSLTGVPNLFNLITSNNQMIQNRNINLSDRVIIPLNQNIIKQNSFGISSYISSQNNAISFFEQKQKSFIQQSHNYLSSNKIISNHNTTIETNIIQPISDCKNFEFNTDLFLKNKENVSLKFYL